MPPRDASPTRYTRFDRDILDGQAFYGIPEAFIRAVIKTESDFDPRVVSSAGAAGADAAASRRRRARWASPTSSTRARTSWAGPLPPGAGAAVLQDAAGGEPGRRGDGEPLTVCSADEKVKVIAGYHAGPAAVEKYGGIPPYETTHAYVAMVLRRYDQYRAAAGGRREIIERATR